MGCLCRKSRFVSEPGSLNGGYGLSSEYWIGDGFEHFGYPSVAEEKTGPILRIQTTDFTEVQAIIANADIAVIPRVHCAGFSEITQLFSAWMCDIGVRG